VILVFRVQLENKGRKVSKEVQGQRVNKGRPVLLEFKVIRVYKE